MIKVLSQLTEAVIIFLINDVGTTRCPFGKKIKFLPFLKPYPRINSKSIRDLNVKNKALQMEKSMDDYNLGVEDVR